MKWVYGLSNEVFMGNGSIGYLGFYDVDTHEYDSVEKMAMYISDKYANDVVIFKTMHGYHVMTLNIISKCYYDYIRIYIELMEKFSILDKYHLIAFIRDGRNVLRLSGRYVDKIIPIMYINSGDGDISGLHYEFLKKVYKYDLGIKEDRIIKTNGIIERYKRRWYVWK